ncbi:uncharacterized protein LOC128200419 [Galleria mellonella]|uniref:Uncharacterized protein LOC128200419 n=1 Tax=Galleria mellonella TaxID=7137 RepID=A0ABM3MEB8_GALME|nr:uncharacterized protein LOC128200419 [Galleria mellonella]
MKDQVYFLLAIFCISVKAVQHEYAPEEIIRPCYRGDLECMQKFIDSRSNCDRPLNRVPDPYLREYSLIYLVDFNITVIHINSNLSGLNGEIEDFHINKNTNQLVIAVWFDKIDVSVENTVVYFHRRREVPIVTGDRSRIVYRRTHITTIVPLSPTIDFNHMLATAYSEEDNLQLTFGPGITAAPGVQTSVATVVGNLDLATRNILFTESRSFISIFIKHVLCGYKEIL